MKIKIRDSKTLKDSIDSLKKKIKDAGFDLTQKGVTSIANSLLAVKPDIDSAEGFAALRDVVKKAVSQHDTPKARETLLEVDNIDRMYQRNPVPGSRNDLWCMEKLLKYVWNLLLKASGNESPDAMLKREYKEREKAKAEDSQKIGDVIVYAEYKANVPGDFWISEGGFKGAGELDANDMFDADKSKAHRFPSIEEAKRFCEEHGIEDFEVQDSCQAKDEEDESVAQIRELVRLLGEAHNLIIEANDLAGDLERDSLIDSSLLYEIEDLEAAASELDFEGEGDPVEALLEKYRGEAWIDQNASDEDEEGEELEFGGEADDYEELDPAEDDQWDE